MRIGTSPELAVREVNDRAFRVLWGVGAEAGDFACECDEKNCSESVERSVIEYAARDDQPLLAPGHQRVARVVAS